MSGVEALGLVLGAIPLVISAFEHFRDACTFQGILFHFEEGYSRTLENVKDEDLFFRFHLRKLLLPLTQVRDVADLDGLILDPGGPAWKYHDVDTLLRSRLADGYDRYMEILKSVDTILHKLLTSLRYEFTPFQEKLDAFKTADATTSLSSRLQLKLKANVRFRARHMNFAVSKWNRDTLVKELHDHVEKLEKILTYRNDIVTLEAQTIVKSSSRTVQLLLQHWRHANRVYELLFRSCACRRKHCAHLWLQHYESADFDLRLLVFFSTPAPPSQMYSWQQQGLHIQSVAQWPKDTSLKPLATQGAGSTRNTSPTKALATPSVIDKAQKMGAKRIDQAKGAVCRLKGPPSSKQPLLPNVSPDQPVVKKARMMDQTASTDTTQSVQEIDDLCRALADCGMQPTCIGTLTAHESTHSYRYKVSSQPEQRLIAGEISLHDVLHSSHRPRLRRATRMRIALKIASSHLKLHSTAWERRQWESPNIKFPCTTGTDGRRQILTDRPFIDTDFVEGSSDHRTLPDPNDDAAATADPDSATRSFVCLGIMLLELLFGAQLEEQHELWRPFVGGNKSGSSSSDGEDLRRVRHNHFFRLMVASRWVRTVEEEAGRNFAAIVRWCLNESPLTLGEDGRWRRELADRVVVPLQTFCEWVPPQDGGLRGVRL